MGTLRITETTARRVAYGLMAWLLVTVVLASLDDTFWPMAAVAGLAAGLWNGRLAEANAAKKGSGILLGQ
jgi:hypothetical protein